MNTIDTFITILPELPLAQQVWLTNTCKELYIRRQASLFVTLQRIVGAKADMFHTRKNSIQGTALVLRELLFDLQPLPGWELFLTIDELSFRAGTLLDHGLVLYLNQLVILAQQDSVESSPEKNWSNYLLGEMLTHGLQEQELVWLQDYDPELYLAVKSYDLDQLAQLIGKRGYLTAAKYILVHARTVATKQRLRLCRIIHQAAVQAGYDEIITTLADYPYWNLGLGLDWLYTNPAALKYMNLTLAPWIELAYQPQMTATREALDYVVANLIPVAASNLRKWVDRVEACLGQQLRILAKERSLLRRLEALDKIRGQKRSVKAFYQTLAIYPLTIRQSPRVRAQALTLAGNWQNMDLVRYLLDQGPAFNFKEQRLLGRALALIENKPAIVQIILLLQERDLWSEHVIDDYTETVIYKARTYVRFGNLWRLRLLANHLDRNTNWNYWERVLGFLLNFLLNDNYPDSTSELLFLIRESCGCLNSYQVNLLAAHTNSQVHIELIIYGMLPNALREQLLSSVLAGKSSLDYFQKRVLECVREGEQEQVSYLSTIAGNYLPPYDLSS